MVTNEHLETTGLDINPDILADEWRNTLAVNLNKHPEISSFGYVPGAPYAFPAPPVSRTLRPGTIIWGFTLIVMGTLVLVSNLLHIRLDITTVSIVMLAAAGLALIGSAISSGIKKSHRRI